MGNEQESTSLVPSVNLEEWLVAAGVASPNSDKRTRCGVGERFLYVGEDLQRLRKSCECPSPLFPAREGSRPWRVGQRYDHPDLGTATEIIREDAANEVDLFLLEWPWLVRQRSLSGAYLPPEDRGGLSVACLDDLASLLSPLKPTSKDGHCPVLALDAGASAFSAAALLIALFSQWENAERLQAFLGIDPLGAFASGSVLSPEIEFAHMTDAALYVAKRHPGVVSLGVNTGVYHLAGASDVQELALAMATGTAYVQSLLEAGMEADAACAQLIFILNADTDFFPQIAKFRAARILWSRIAGILGASETGRMMNLQAESSLRFLTRYSPWINIARVATAGSAAVIAGVDGLLLHPFTRALGVAEQEARRIARNTHFLLSDEALLGEVCDAGKAGWSIEAMTHDMAEAAWRLFQEISKEGGMTAVLRSGWVAERIEEQRDWRAGEIATCAARIVGINIHPCLEDEIPSIYSVDAEERRSMDARVLAGAGECKTGLQPGKGESFAQLMAQAADGASLGELAGTSVDDNVQCCKPLARTRESQPWEVLRDAGLAYKARHGELPGVFLVNGALGENSRQRLAGIDDLLNCAGLRVAGETSIESGIAEALQAFAKSGALFAAFLWCGNEDKMSAVTESADAVHRAGAKGVWLWLQGGHAKRAGQPFSLVIDHGTDLPAEFSRIHKFLSDG